jgi:integrase
MAAGRVTRTRRSTPEHAAQIIAHVAQHDPDAAEVVRWQFVSGLRISEAIRLRTDQIDFEQATVAIKGKGGKVRVIEIPDRALLDQLDRTVRFPLLRGTAASWTRSIEKRVAEACAELDIKCLGTHGLRACARRTGRRQSVGRRTLLANSADGSPIRAGRPAGFTRQGAYDQKTCNTL